MYCNVMHAWRHVFLCCSMYVTQGKEIANHHLSMPACCIIKEGFDFCVSMFLRSQGYVLWCATHLPLCSTKGAVEISLLSTKDYSLCRCRRKSFLLLLSSGSIVECSCEWVLWSAQNASANARHGKRRTACMILKVWTALLSIITLFETLKFVSLSLLGKLGIKQYFQKVSGQEIAQSTEEWLKNDVVTVNMKERIFNESSTCLSALNRDDSARPSAGPCWCSAKQTNGFARANLTLCPWRCSTGCCSQQVAVVAIGAPRPGCNWFWNWFFCAHLAEDKLQNSMGRVPLLLQDLCRQNLCHWHYHPQVWRNHQLWWELRLLPQHWNHQQHHERCFAREMLLP